MTFDPNEGPDATDLGGDGDSVDTAPCPYCRRPIYEDAEVCRHCGIYVSREDSTTRKPLWIVAGALACLGVVLWLWVR